MKECFVSSHCGLGDSINMIPAIRYLLTKYDKINLTVKNIFLENIKLFYTDVLDKICLIPLHSPPLEYNEVSNLIIKYNNIDMYLGGLHFDRLGRGSSSIHNPNISVPRGFYNDMNLSFDELYLSKKWFNYSSVVDKTILEKCKKYNIIFVHKETSTQTTSLIYKKIKDKIELDEILIIDEGTNYYNSNSSEKFELAQYFIKKPIAYYIEIFKEAKEIYVTDSCLFCICLQLSNLKALIKEVYLREYSPFVIKTITEIDPTFNCFKI
jgi:hypothetical protein